MKKTFSSQPAEICNRCVTRLNPMYQNATLRPFDDDPFIFSGW